MSTMKSESHDAVYHVRLLCSSARHATWKKFLCACNTANVYQHQWVDNYFKEIAARTNKCGVLACPGFRSAMSPTCTRQQWRLCHCRFHAQNSKGFSTRGRHTLSHGTLALRKIARNLELITVVRGAKLGVLLSSHPSTQQAVADSRVFDTEHVLSANMQCASGKVRCDTGRLRRSQRKSVATESRPVHARAARVDGMTTVEKHILDYGGALIPGCYDALSARIMAKQGYKVPNSAVCRCCLSYIPLCFTTGIITYIFWSGCRTCMILCVRDQPEVCRSRQLCMLSQVAAKTHASTRSTSCKVGVAEL